MHELILPCKSYVKRHLINQYGNPVDLRKNRHYFNYLKLLLQRKQCRYNKRINLKNFGKRVYYEEVKIILDDDTFNRFGFELTPTSVMEFNAFIEDSIKTHARLLIVQANSFGQTWVDAIRDFQEAFGFTEDDFPTDSIKKDLQRHKDILETFEKTFGTNVPNLGASVSA